MIQLSEYGIKVVNNFNLIGMWIAVLVCCRNFSICLKQYQRTKGKIHLVNLAQVTVFLIHRFLYGLIPLFEIKTCAYFPLLISLWHITYILFYIVMFMRLIILELDRYSRWIKIISVLLIGLRAADWPYELAFHTIQQHIIKEAPQSGSQCWAVWGEGVIILNFVGDALANLFLSGMFVRRLFIHIHTSKSLISYRNETIERIAQKSLICLAFTFLVNLAMNLLKITMFIGEHSDAFTVYFEIIESTLLVEALRNDGYQSTHHTSQCASCQKELNQDINTKRGLDTTNCLNSQAFLRSFHNIDNKQNKHYSAYTLDTYDENRIRHVVSSTEPVLISDKNYSSFTSSIQLNEGPSNTSRTQNQSMLTLMEDPPTHNKLIPQYNTNIDKLSSPRLSSSIITSVPIAGDSNISISSDDSSP